jgi:hypothetical protein
VPLQRSLGAGDGEKIVNISYMFDLSDGTKVVFRVEGAVPPGSEGSE